MESLEIRRLERAGRKAVEISSNLSPQAFLDAAEIADKRGDAFALSSIGRIDLLAHLVKG